jgi:hypothetical protein
MPNDEREELFRIAAAEMQMPEAVIEKDFWVCYTLDYLFHRSKFKKHIVFKGGTSLSKAFGLIDRFSEDVDLILDWRLLGYEEDEPWRGRSNTQQDKFKNDSIERTSRFLSESFIPDIKESIFDDVGYEADIYQAEEAETVLFAYPRIHHLAATLDVIRLEIGPLAAWSPAVKANITSYLAEKRPQIFDRPSTEVVTAAPERTFWEKVSILHQEAHRPETKRMLPRYSRHYYDIFRFANSAIKMRAFDNIALLEKVVTFKMPSYSDFLFAADTQIQPFGCVSQRMPANPFLESTSAKFSLL